MNIAIVAPSSVPFVVGGAEKFWRGLLNGFIQYSEHFIELIKLPCKEGNFWELIDSYYQFSRLDLSHFDLVISTKYPAWMVRHHNHMVYLQHTLRGLYDTYHLTHLPTGLEKCDKRLANLVQLLENAPKNRDSVDKLFELLFSYKHTHLASLPDFAFPGPLCRAVVQFFDASAMSPKEVKTYAAISHNVKQRENYFPEDSSVTVLHHPSDLRNFHTKEGKFIFTSSRMVHCKRIDLIIKAMKYVEEDIPLLIAGSGPEMDALKAQAADDARIKFLGYVSDDELCDLYAQALCVPFVPRDEDYGLITIEAMMSKKPVVTVEDSGGVCEFVEDGVTGYCTKCNPKDFGTALQKMVADPARAREMGENAYKKVSGITWENTIKTLQELNKDVLSQRPTKKIVVATTFPIYPPVSGGQLRIFNIYKELAQSAEIVLITYGNFYGQRSKEIRISKHFKEIRLPWPSEFVSLREKLRKITKTSIDDLIAMQTCEEDALLTSTLSRECENAALVVASHPYLYPALKSFCKDIPLWYDAHNVEYFLKKDIAKGQKELEGYIDSVFQIEKECCSQAHFITCCSQFDRENIHELYHVDQEKLVVLPNGFNSKEVELTEKTERDLLQSKLDVADNLTALFIGSEHGPNLEAVRTIAKIAEKVPDVVFLIAGTVCNSFSEKKLPKNVFLMGQVTTAEKKILLSACDVGLNPMQSGSGTNLKIIEYIAAGLEVLTTKFGMRGLEDCLSGKLDFYEIDTFAAVLTEMLNGTFSGTDKALLREVVEKNFSWHELVFQANIFSLFDGQLVSAAAGADADGNNVQMPCA